jgi:hypothetical protein
MKVNNRGAVDTFEYQQICMQVMSMGFQVFGNGVMQVKFKHLVKSRKGKFFGFRPLVVSFVHQSCEKLCSNLCE